MANPQAENGHIRVATELEDQLCTLPLSGSEWRFLRFVIRMSWGWNKKRTGGLGFKKICEGTALKRISALRASESLSEKNILIIHKEKNKNDYEFNKDYETWVVSNWIPKIVSKKILGSIKNDTISSIKNDTKLNSPITNYNHSLITNITRDQKIKNLEKLDQMKKDAGLI